MHRVEPVQHAGHDGVHHRERDPLALRGRALHQRRERKPGHVLHHQKKLAVGGDDIERRHDVGVIDAARDASFVDEHRHELRLFGEVRVQPLDRHRPPESARPHQPPEVHRRHPSGGDFPIELVPINPRRSRSTTHQSRLYHTITGDFAPEFAQGGWEFGSLGALRTWRS